MSQCHPCRVCRCRRSLCTCKQIKQTPFVLGSLFFFKLHERCAVAASLDLVGDFHIYTDFKSLLETWMLFFTALTLFLKY